MPEELIDIVRREAATHLTAYFAEDGPLSYTGRWFETVAGGGDRAGARDRITFDDLFAVQALSVQVPAKVGKELVDGPLGVQVSAHLRKIGTDVEMGTPPAAALLAPGSPADQAWHLLNDRNTRTGIGWVIAGKLLARKRPRLIPVYDSVVSCQFGAPAQVWVNLHQRLSENGGALRAELVAARSEADVADRVSVLRALDVVLWRRHVDDHMRDRTSACPGRGTVALLREPARENQQGR